MNDPVYLTEDELVGITGKQRHPAQRRALEAMEIPFRLRPDGSLLVTRAGFEQAINGTPRPRGREPKLHLV